VGRATLPEINRKCRRGKHAMRDGRETQQDTSWAVRGRAGEKEARTSQDSPRGETPARRVLEGDAAGEPPRWDAAAGQLRWRGLLLKSVRHDATNQRLVLDAFQRQGWPQHIDNPFPPGQGLKRKQRLRNAVRALNARHRLARLLFHSDKEGGISWEAII
jgi:hypothetical protein